MYEYDPAPTFTYCSPFFNCYKQLQRGPSPTAARPPASAALAGRPAAALGLIDVLVACSYINYHLACATLPIWTRTPSLIRERVPPYSPLILFI